MTCLILAPARPGRPRRAARQAADVLRAAGHEVALPEVFSPAEAAARAETAARQGLPLVVAVGGDGSLHEVAGGLLRAPAPLRTALGLIPAGGGNDYARMLGLPRSDPRRAAQLLLRARERRVDVGRLSGIDGPPGHGHGHFLNNMGLALLAQATLARETLRPLSGHPAYLAGGGLALLRHRPSPLRLDVDGETFEGRYAIVQVALGRYCGAGICLTPDARLDGGRFSIYLLDARSRGRIALQWPRIMRGRPVAGATWLHGRRLRIRGPAGMPLHADGEIRHAPTGEIEIELRPRALTVLSAV